MSKISNEQMFAAINEVKVTNEQMSELINKLTVGFIELKEKVNDQTEGNKKIKEDVVYIRSVVEQDAKKQKDHEVEHVSNVAAHDRFETRIKALEAKK